MTGRPTYPDRPAPPPAAIRRASLLLVVEAAALTALGVIVVVKAVTGTPRSVLFAATAGLMAIGTGAVLLLLARALHRVRRWAYAPVLVLQGLALPVGYSLAAQAGRWLYGGPVLLMALSELCLLITPSARRALGSD